MDNCYNLEKKKKTDSELMQLIVSWCLNDVFKRNE